MKTAEEAAIEYAKNVKYLSDFIHDGPSAKEGFLSGVAFAEEWISVEDELPLKGETILLIYDNNPKRIVSGFLDKIDGSPRPHWRGEGWIMATHWRPVNRK